MRLPWSDDATRPHTRRRPLGGLNLTDEGLRAIGVEPTRLVPLVSIPWRDERRDLRTTIHDAQPKGHR